MIGGLDGIVFSMCVRVGTVVSASGGGVIVTVVVAVAVVILVVAVVVGHMSGKLQIPSRYLIQALRCGIRTLLTITQARKDKLPNFIMPSW